MYRPYDYAEDGQTKIDLNNELHRKIVMERNVNLQKKKEGYHDISELCPDINVTVNCTCPRCGGEMNANESIDSEEAYKPLEDLITSIKCEVCKASWSKTFYFSENRFSDYKLRLPSIHKIKKLKKAN